MSVNQHLRSVLALAVIVLIVVVSLTVLIDSLSSAIRVEPPFTDPGDRLLLVMSPARHDLESAYGAA